MPSGKISWFGGPGDPSAGPTTASGAPVTAPGIAVYNRQTLGGYYLVSMPNGRRAVLRQTDIGPAPFTGRAVDFTYSALPALGYSTNNFPTNASIGYQYIGQSIPPNLQSIAIGAGAGAGASSASSSSTGNYGGLSGFLLKAVLTVSLVIAGMALAGVGARSVAGHARKQT